MAASTRTAFADGHKYLGAFVVVVALFSVSTSLHAQNLYGSMAFAQTGDGGYAWGLPGTPKAARWPGNWRLTSAGGPAVAVAVERSGGFATPAAPLRLVTAMVMARVGEIQAVRPSAPR